MNLAFSEYLLFLAFSLSILSAWIFPRYVPFILSYAACFIAIGTHNLRLSGFAALVFMALLINTYYHKNSPLKTSMVQKRLVRIAIIACVPLFYLHLIPGFSNPRLLDGLRLSQDSLPYNLYLNIDKIFVGFMLLLHGATLERTRSGWKKIIRTIPIPLGLVVLVLIGGSLALGYVRLDLKWPAITWLWIPGNLLFVCMAEEAFFRGFIQRDLITAFANIKRGSVIAIGIASLLFGIAHFQGGLSYMILATFAGLSYGYVYHRTHRLEAAMLVHFLVNLIHFLCFSYPALDHAL